jgi:hypothetical protein
VKKLSIPAVLAFVALVSGAVGSQADSGSGTFVYVAGTEPLCTIIGPAACPDVARADNGDTVEIAGSGSLSIHSKSVVGGGSFTHKAPDGTVRATGTWSALTLLSFNSYGNQLGLPPNLVGGLARMRVHLAPSAGGPGVDALLEIDCEIGKVPGGHLEGVRLVVDNGQNFNQKVSGFTVFVQ